MPEITFDLVLPQYLRQWLINEMGGAVPVSFPKGSAFSSFLRVFLRHKRESEGWVQRNPEAVAIVIPKFPGRDPQYYNYMPAKAAAALVELIRDAFDVKLYRELKAFANIGRKHSDIIEVWMEQQGIEITDRTYAAVIKRYQLLKARESDRERKRIDYHRKKKQHIV